MEKKEDDIAKIHKLFGLEIVLFAAEMHLSAKRHLDICGEIC